MFAFELGEKYRLGSDDDDDDDDDDIAGWRWLLRVGLEYEDDGRKGNGDGRSFGAMPVQRLCLRTV